MKKEACSVLSSLQTRGNNAKDSHKVMVQIIVVIVVIAKSYKNSKNIADTKHQQG